MKILFAEDTKDLNRAVCAVLTHEGYDVQPAYDGLEALDYIQKDSYDCIVLDIMMPGADGLEVLRQLRASGQITPVLLLTARSEVDDRVEGLDAGADDYLTKPFAMKELLARLRALGRRKNHYGTENLTYEDISLHPSTFELSGENTVRLSIKEFELLHTLLLNNSHELSTEYLLEHVWKEEPDAAEETVWLYISYLKRKLRSVCSEVSIEGVRGGSFILKGKE